MFSSPPGEEEENPGVQKAVLGADYGFRSCLVGMMDRLCFLTQIHARFVPLTLAVPCATEICAQICAGF